MRARGRGMTWWARTAQKSGSRLLPNAAVPVWLSSALRTSAMAPEKKLETGAPWLMCGRGVDRYRRYRSGVGLFPRPKTGPSSVL